MEGLATSESSKFCKNAKIRRAMKLCIIVPRGSWRTGSYCTFTELIKNIHPNIYPVHPELHLTPM
jgi:hypothetical protein